MRNFTWYVMCEVALGYIYAYLSLVGLLCFGVVWGCLSLISWVIVDHAWVRPGLGYVQFHLICDV